MPRHNLKVENIYYFQHLNIKYIHFTQKQAGKENRLTKSDKTKESKHQESKSKLTDVNNYVEYKWTNY